MIQVLVGGLLAIAGGVLASYVNAVFQRRDMAVKDRAERTRVSIDNRNRAYYEFISFLNQFLQFLHPSVGESEYGKYTAGLTLVEHIKAFAHVFAGVQLYGSRVVGQLLTRFFDSYNEIPEKNSAVDKSKFDELNAIGAEIIAQMRSEIEADMKTNIGSDLSKEDPKLTSSNNASSDKFLLTSFLKEWSNVFIAIATVITCCIAGCEFHSGGETWREVAEMFMSAERPVICVERVPYSSDGKNLDHEDCRILNLGALPRYYQVRDIKEYLVMNFTGSPVPHWLRRVVVPIQFYQYGVLTQGLRDVIYEEKGECARLKAFEHYKRTYDFFASHGIGYYDSVDILAHVSYVDRFGKEVECYYKCDSVGGQRELTKEEYEQYAVDAEAYIENPVPLEFEKIDLEDMLNNWVLPECPVKKTWE